MTKVQPWRAGTACPEPAYPDFAAALNKASHHYADDSGKEWGQAEDCIKQAIEIAVRAAWPYWAMQRMYKEIAPLPTFDHFMGAYCQHALAGMNPAALGALIEALEWYADPVLPYAITQAKEPRSAVHGDGGNRARTALAALRGGAQ